MAATATEQEVEDEEEEEKKTAFRQNSKPVKRGGERRKKT